MRNFSDYLIGSLRENGWVVIPNLNPELSALSEYVENLSATQMHRAGIGRARESQEQPEVRGDTIMWLQDSANPAVGLYVSMMESLRLEVNRQLYLGLFDYECHFAHYAPGAFYRKHKDSFASDRFKSGNRKLSSVFYLNEKWKPEDGGELVLYHPQSECEIVRVMPELGTLVLFLSEEFPHEVLPANRTRWSLTGWFRSRPDF